MRRSPTPTGRIPRSWALLLGLCLIALTMVPVASAAVSAGEGGTVSCMAAPERGRVTDGDGWIGNGRRGADRSDGCGFAPFAKDAEDHPSPRHPDGSSHMRDGGHFGTGDHSEGQPEKASPDEGTGADGTTGVDETLGILPFILGMLALLAIVLIILARLPRKDRSHR